MRLSFSELAAKSLEVTKGAVSAAIHPGDRVAVWAPNMRRVGRHRSRSSGSGRRPRAAQHQVQGPRGRLRPSRSQAQALFTVRGFLGIDYPAMLEERTSPHLERIVLLRDDEGTTSEPTAPTRSPSSAGTNSWPVPTGSSSATRVSSVSPVDEHDDARSLAGRAPATTCPTSSSRRARRGGPRER